MTDLNVLLVESFAGAGRAEATRLEEAGHRVVRCHAPGAPDFPCRGLQDDSHCPLDDGVDVALSVRGRCEPQPSGREQGASCAIRAGVPLVEAAHGIASPFEPFATSAGLGDVVSRVESVARFAEEEVAEALAEATARAADLVGIAPEELTYTVDSSGPSPTVVVSGPKVDSGGRNKIAVRVFDALRDRGVHVSGVAYRESEVIPAG